MPPVRMSEDALKALKQADLLGKVIPDAKANVGVTILTGGIKKDEAILELVYKGVSSSDATKLVDEAIEAGKDAIRTASKEMDDAALATLRADLKKAGHSDEFIDTIARIGGSGFAFHEEHFIRELAEHYPRSPLLQALPENCGQSCAFRLLGESGVNKLNDFFAHSGATSADELATFLSRNGMSGVQHGSTSLHTMVDAARNGKPGIALIKNVDGNGHWVIIDGVLDFDQDVLLMIRDPGSGAVGYMKMIDFDMHYFAGRGVWFN